MSDPQKSFDAVYSDGTLLIRLRNGMFPQEQSLPQLRDELVKLAQEHRDCTAIAIDVRGLPLIASAVLACLIEIRRRGFEVELRNVSSDVRQHLEVTRLDQLIRVRPEEPTI